VTASDERSNTTETSLRGSRVSETVVVDNTGPVIRDCSVEIAGGRATIRFKSIDELSAIGQVHYTVDSNNEWVGTIPKDLVYDTTEEDFTVVVEGLEVGEHVISVRAGDALGNTTYKSFEVKVQDAAVKTR
jgi:hypothetical protein